MESVALVIAVEGSQQVQDTLFKSYEGASARLFRPTYALSRGTRPVSYGFIFGLRLEIECGGIPHLAKNERDVRHPALSVSEKPYGQQHPGGHGETLKPH